MLAIASLFGAVASTTSAPPSFCSPSAAVTFCVSMYSCAPSSRASSSLSAPREIATVRKPICAAYWIAEVAEAADALHRDRVAGARAAVAQRVVRRDAGAQQRAGVDGSSPSGMRATASCGTTTYSA